MSRQCKSETETSIILSPGREDQLRREKVLFGRDLLVSRDLSQFGISLASIDAVSKYGNTNKTGLKFLFER